MPKRLFAETVPPQDWCDETKVQDADEGLALALQRLSFRHLLHAYVQELSAQGCTVVPAHGGQALTPWKTAVVTPEPSAFTTDQIGILTEPSGLCVVHVPPSELLFWGRLLTALHLTELVRHETPYALTTTGAFHFYFKNPVAAGAARA